MMAGETVSYDEIRRGVNSRVRALLEAFEFRHLPPELQAVSKPFCDLAHLDAAAIPSRGQLSCAVHLEHGLQHLLQAKDAIVRAALSVPV